MSMTRSELAAHADRMAGLLEAKRHQIDNAEMGPVSRAHLLLQIDALTLRVGEITRQCEKMRDQETADAAFRLEASSSRALVQASHVSPT
jgi:hypothetical protein